jgi:hypothetical protein
MGNSNIHIFSTSVRTAICNRSSPLIEFPQEPVKQLANTTHITDSMYEGKGNSQSEMNKNTLTATTRFSHHGISSHATTRCGRLKTAITQNFTLWSFKNSHNTKFRIVAVSLMLQHVVVIFSAQ